MLDGAQARNNQGAPMFKPKVFWRHTVLKKVLAILLELFYTPCSDSAAGKFCPSPYAPGRMKWFCGTNLARGP